MKRLPLLLATAAIAAGLAAAPVQAREPGPTIVETAIAVNAQTGEFDHLIEAVVAAGLVDTLNGNRQFTVFAPTDAAFEALFDTLGVDGISDIPPATLRAVLLHHVAPGERFSGAVVGSTRVRLLDRSFAYPSVRGGNAYIDDARIIAPDIDVSNGVIHVIDAVLLP